MKVLAGILILALLPFVAAAPAVNECATPGAGWLWCDDFEQDRLRTPSQGGGYFEYNDDGGEFIRVASTGVEGSTGMRAYFEQGDVGAGDLKVAFGRTPQAYFQPVAGTAGNDYRDVYWRMYVRNQPGWTGGGGDKLSRATIFASPSTWAQALFAHVWSGGSGSNHLVLDPASGTDTAGALQTTTYNDFANMRWLGANDSDTALFTGANIGQWHCVETRVRLNDAGQNNGVFELWINNQLESQRLGLNWVGSYSEYGINSVMFENYWNSGSPVTQERYFDNIVVSTQRIGCGAARRVGDLNNDGTVDINDVILIIANFRRRQNYDDGADINGDGTVNVLDMVLLGRNWGSGDEEAPPETPPDDSTPATIIEDFSTYSGTAELMADPRGIYQVFEDINTAQITLDTTTGYGESTQSMRYDYPDRTVDGGSNGRCGDYSISRSLRFPNNGDIQEVWVEVVAKTSANFTTQAPAEWGCTSDQGLKFLNGNVNPGDRFSIGLRSGTNAPTTGQLWFGYPNNKVDPEGKVNFASTGNVIDGEWHRYRCYWRISTGYPGAPNPDGRMACWVDGTLVVDQEGIITTSTAGNTPPMRFYGLSLGRNINQGPDRPQSIWWGQVRMWDSDPGWEEAQPPVNTTPPTETSNITLVLNNLSFETGFDGFNAGGSGDPFMTRTTTQSYLGSHSLTRTWTANPGGDSSGWTTRSLPSSYDDVWVRFYMRLSSGWSITSFHKLFLFWDSSYNDQFGGFGLNDQNGLHWSFYGESSSALTTIVPKASLTTDTWHCVEVNYKRNGDALPSAEFWFNNNQITHADGAASGGNGLTWSNNRLSPGNRALSSRIGVLLLSGVLNGGNTGSGQLWLDGISVATGGRIGCGPSDQVPTPPVEPVVWNEPAGFTPLVERRFDTRAENISSGRGTGSFPNKTGGSEGWDDIEYTASLHSIVQDATAPTSAPNVLQYRWPAQTVAAGGTFAPGITQTQGFTGTAHGRQNFTKLYHRFTYKMSENFQNHPSGTKILYHRTTEGQPQGYSLRCEPIIGVRGTRVYVNLQGCQDNEADLGSGLPGYLFPNTPEADTTDANNFNFGEWYTFEVLLELNSAYDVADGKINVWMQGPNDQQPVHIIEHNALRLRSGPNPQYWNNIHQGQTWGGQGGTINEDMYTYMDHDYVSGAEPDPEESAGAEPFLIEDFSTYASTAEFLSDPRNIYSVEDFRTDRITLDTTTGYGDSTQSMRYDYPAGTGTDYTISRGLSVPSTQELWVEAAVRFDPTFTIEGNGQAAGSALKFLHVNIQGGPAGRFGVNMEGSDTSTIRAEGPNDAYDDLYFYGITNNNAFFDGNWHLLRYHVRLNGTEDFHEFWVDGVYQGNKTGDTAATGIYHVSLARNINKLAANAQSMWWGSVKLWNEDPGWT